MDESGEHVGDYDHDVYKERLDSSGRAIVKAKSEGKKKKIILSSKKKKKKRDNLF